jgi:hypothetical protein
VRAGHSRLAQLPLGQSRRSVFVLTGRRRKDTAGPRRKQRRSTQKSYATILVHNWRNIPIALIIPKRWRLNFEVERSHSASAPFGNGSAQSVTVLKLSPLHVAPLFSALRAVLGQRGGQFLAPHKRALFQTINGVCSTLLS